MAEANAIKYLNAKHKNSAWLCGDDERKSCGLSGKLTDLDCGGCFYKAGQMGRNCISKDAVIHYNPNLSSLDFVEKE